MLIIILEIRRLSCIIKGGCLHIQSLCIAERSILMTKDNIRNRLASIGRLVKKVDYYYVIIPLCFVALMFVFGAFTGMWPWNHNYYNSFALQANSWLQGRLDVDGELLTWLELAIYDDMYYVSFPPFPSYVLLPFALIFGTNTPDMFIMMIFSSLGAIFTYRLCKEFLGEERRADSFLFTMLIYVGSNTVFFQVSPWVWFFAQNISFTFTILALYYAHKAKPVWSFAFWACAVGSRPFQILLLPLMLMLMIRTWKSTEKNFSFWKKVKTRWFEGIPCVIIALSYCVLNYARFGSIIEFGHNYLPEFIREEQGQFSITYLGRNLARMFRLPEVGTKGLNFYNADGIAFWLVNPIFLLLLVVLIYSVCKWICRNNDTKADTILGIIITVIVSAHIVILCMHRTLGGWHFGNRYTCDMIPAVLIGILLMMPKSEKFMPLPRLVFMFGFMLNLLGTVAAYNYWI